MENKEIRKLSEEESKRLAFDYELVKLKLLTRKMFPNPPKAVRIRINEEGK